MQYKEKKLITLKLIFLLIIFYSSLTAETINLTEAQHIHYYDKDISENEACIIALKKAKNKAINSLGEKITSESIMQCKEIQSSQSCQQFSNIWAESEGIIKKYDNLREAGYDSNYEKKYCKQTIIAEVIKLKKLDPNFDFETKLNKSVFEFTNANLIKKSENKYESKENIKIEIIPTNKLFLNIFYYTPIENINIFNQKVFKIFPNSICNDNKINKKTIIPDIDCKKEYKFKLNYTYKDILQKKPKQEFLLLIATKENIKFNNEYIIKDLKSKINEIDRFKIRKKDIVINVYFSN